ncbi:MAG TPA: hypothetical protein VF650_09060 [Allosphingosinicella sp.]|jgi:hypothetical protein
MKAVIPILALPALLCACASPTSRTAARSQLDLRVSAQIAQQVRRCYRAPRIPSAARAIVTRLLVRYGPDGVPVGLPLLVGQQGVTPETRPFAVRMTEAARLAVLHCSPVRLPAEKGNEGTSDFYLTFSPTRRV